MYYHDDNCWFCQNMERCEDCGGYYRPNDKPRKGHKEDAED